MIGSRSRVPYRSLIKVLLTERIDAEIKKNVA